MPRTSALRVVSQLTGGLCCAVALAGARPAHAEAPATVRLTYRAPEGCPGASELEREVRRFLPTLRSAAPGQQARAFEAEIADDQRHGRLFVVEAGVRGVREVEGASCAEVARLLAFSIALAVDPNVKPLDEPAASAAFDEAPAPEPAPSPTPAPEPQASAKAVAARPAPQAAPQRAAPLDWSAAVHGFAASALAPHATLGAGGSLDASWRVGSLRPLVRVGGSYSTSEPALVDGATITFRNGLGLLELCPHVWQNRSVSFALCLRADVGIRTATGSDIPGARARPRAWLSVEPVARSRWRLGAPLFLELGAGPLIPVLHDRVYLRPDTTVHDVPILGFIGEFGVGVEFGDQTEN